MKSKILIGAQMSENSNKSWTLTVCTHKVKVGRQVVIVLWQTPDSGSNAKEYLVKELRNNENLH
jgi:hypothetical protein